MEGTEWRIGLRAIGGKSFPLASIAKSSNVQICMGALGAHGDMRLLNVAVLFGSNQWHVRFVDFDWGGVAWEHMYPPFMNTKVGWAAGAQPFAVVLSSHDAALLQMQFD